MRNLFPTQRCSRAEATRMTELLSNHRAEGQYIRRRRSLALQLQIYEHGDGVYS